MRPATPLHAHAREIHCHVLLPLSAGSATGIPARFAAGFFLTAEILAEIFHHGNTSRQTKASKQPIFPYLYVSPTSSEGLLLIFLYLYTETCSLRTLSCYLLSAMYGSSLAYGILQGFPRAHLSSQTYTAPDTSPTRSVKSPFPQLSAR